jgi:acetyl esterase/lipase
MTRGILLALGLACMALGLLTVVRSPDWLDWRLAVLAGQFGYLIAAVPLAVGLVAWRTSRGTGMLTRATCAACACAAALLLQPCAQAWVIGRGLPGRFDRLFGAGGPGTPAFSVAGLFRRWPAPASRSTWAYSGPLKLDFYRAVGRSPAPCVIVVHGGGWDNGERGQIPQFNDWLAGQGYAVADISYRLAPAAVWPAQRDDVAAAIAFVKAHAGDWGVDPSRLVIMGRSAGGQIAEASAYFLADPAVRGVIALYAPADMRFAWEWGRPDDVLNSLQLLRQFLGGTPDSAGPAYDSASAYLIAGPRSPPTLLVHGVIDTLVWQRQSARLAARLTQAGVPNLFVSLPWATHALELNLSGPSGQLTTYSVGRFLSAVCR